MAQIFPKDPGDRLDWKFDFKSTTNGSDTDVADVLASGETISSRTVTADDGITVDSSSITDTNTSVTVWLSGGTAGEEYTVTCTIVTSAGRTYEEHIKIQVRH